MEQCTGSVWLVYRRLKIGAKALYSHLVLLLELLEVSTASISQAEFAFVSLIYMEAEPVVLDSPEVHDQLQNENHGGACLAPFFISPTSY